MSTDPDLLLDAGRPTVAHLLFVLIVVTIGLVAGMALGIGLMSGLLPSPA